MTNLIDVIWKTVTSPFIRPAPPVYKPVAIATQQYRQPQTQYALPPQPKTALQELIELNPLFAGLKLSDEQVQSHLDIERRNYQNKMEKARLQQDAELMRNLKKKNLEQISTQMESQYLAETSRRLQFQQELASLNQKYQEYPQPVRFS